MLEKETTLILGAGSSIKFGLPLGSQLKKDIATALDIYFADYGRDLKRGSYEIVDAFRALGQREDNHNLNTYLHAAGEIADALPVCGSIDDYIERHSGHLLYETCAKLGIAHCILRGERESFLRADPNRNDPPKITSFEGSWIDQFLQLITRGCRLDDLHSTFSNLSVINFNYDRCFEQFSFFWLKRVYKVSDEAAQNIISSINLVHPYGSLGPLPQLVERGGIPFGYNPSPDELIDVASRIRTYSESTKDPDRSSAIDKAVQDCRNFVILGFAFHPQNMTLLQCEPSPRAFTRHVYASAVGVPEPRWTVIRQRLRVAFEISDDLLYTDKVKESCEELFYEYGDNIVT